MMTMRVLEDGVHLNRSMASGISPGLCSEDACFHMTRLVDYVDVRPGFSRHVNEVCRYAEGAERVAMYSLLNPARNPMAVEANPNCARKADTLSFPCGPVAFCLPDPAARAKFRHDVFFIHCRIECNSEDHCLPPRSGGGRPCGIEAGAPPGLITGGSETRKFGRGLKGLHSTAPEASVTMAGRDGMESFSTMRNFCIRQ